MFSWNWNRLRTLSVRCVVFDCLWWMLLGECMGKFVGVFRFSGWNCLKNYENVEKGEC